MNNCPSFCLFLFPAPNKVRTFMCLFFFYHISSDLEKGCEGLMLLLVFPQWSQRSSPWWRRWLMEGWWRAARLWMWTWIRSSEQQKKKKKINKNHAFEPSFSCAVVSNSSGVWLTFTFRKLQSLFIDSLMLGHNTRKTNKPPQGCRSEAHNLYL